MITASVMKELNNIYVEQSKLRSSITCYYSTGIGYTGRINRTIAGVPCRPWLENPYINNITYPTLVKNYCRNPEGLHQKPWCYTSADRRKWDYCPVDKCPDGNYYHFFFIQISELFFLKFFSIFLSFVILSFGVIFE